MKFSRKPVQWEPSWHMWTDGQHDEANTSLSRRWEGAWIWNYCSYMPRVIWRRSQSLSTNKL